MTENGVVLEQTTQTVTRYCRGIMGSWFIESERELVGDQIILKIGGSNHSLTRKEWDDLVGVVLTTHEALKGVK